MFYSKQILKLKWNPIFFYLPLVASFLTHMTRAKGPFICL